MFGKGIKVLDTFSDTQGFLTGKKRPFGQHGETEWEVDYISCKKYRRESYLEEMADDKDLFEMFRDKQFGKIVDLRRIVSSIRISGKLTNLFYSMQSSCALFMPHQFKPVMKFLESNSGRLLIADEVGLGKTIEAMYIWKEIVARENAKRCLIVVPAQLREKWKKDIATYFDITAQVCDAKLLLEKISSWRAASRKSEVLITSLQGIRYKDTDAEILNAKKRLNDFLMSCVGEELFDLVVIDEAHYLRNSSTAGFKTGERLRDVSKYVVLLSATPIQTSSENLYNLLNLLAPEEYYDKKSFEHLLEENTSLIQFANAVHDSSEYADGQLEELYNKASPLLKVYPEVADKIENIMQKERALFDTKYSIQIFNLVRNMRFYAQYFTRTRKCDVFENRVKRVPKTVGYDFNDTEKQIYNKVTHKLQSKAEHSTSVVTFMLIARQRQMSSCMPAAIKHWRDNNILKDLVYENFGMDTAEEAESVVLSSEEWDEDFDDVLIEKLKRNDRKYEELRGYIRDVIDRKPSAKMVIFSFYRYTIDYLRERLLEDGYSCVSIKGGMGENKDDIINRFKEDETLNILISSEVGSEGIDLQNASTEINYDMPWNPMRLEQRIGRIDRIGQKAKEIHICNFYCNDTVEDRVLRRLMERIEVIKNSIGDMEDVLGSFVQELSVDIFTTKKSDKEKEELAEKRIEERIKLLKKFDEEELKEQAAISTAFSEEIMKNINTANTNKRYILPSELLQYTKDFFSNNYPGTNITPFGTYTNACYILLSQDAKLDYKEYRDKNGMAFGNFAYNSGKTICNFDPQAEEKYKKYPHEIIDINHPFIKWMRDESKRQEQKAALMKCSAIQIACGKKIGFKDGLYVYYIMLWKAEGWSEQCLMRYFLYDVNRRQQINSDESERLCIEAMANGEDCSDIDILNYDDIISSISNLKDSAIEQYEKYEADYVSDNRTVCSSQLHYLDITRERKDSRFQELIRNMELLGGKTKQQIIMTEGKMKKEDERMSLQRREIEKRMARCRVENSDIAVGIIKVGGKNAIG